MNKRKWRWWSNKPVEPRWLKIEAVRREVNRLTVGEWRADKQWVATAAGVLHDPRVQQMLDAVANSAPGFEVLPLSAGAMERAVQQARQEGYIMALTNFAALGREQALLEAVEATFEEPVRPPAMGG